MSTVRLGNFELDPHAGELRAAGSITRIQDKPLQLLLLLLESPNALVTREQIRDRMWGPSRHHDFEDSLNQAVRKLREAFGDSASDPKVIETIPRRGYRLIARVETQTRSAAAAGARSTSRRVTVGRQRELCELRTMFAEAAAGHGRIACISGEPGIGKTTLAEMLIDSLIAEGSCRVAIGRCSERYAGAEAYLPILEALESLLRSPDQELLAGVLRNIAPSWYAEMPSPGAGAGLAEAKAATQERRKREFVAFLAAASKDRPLLLFIDDVHWSDPSSVDLLAYAIPRAAKLSVFFLGTFRPSDLARAGHPFLQVKRELQAHRHCREIELTPLRQEDVEAYIELEYPNNEFSQAFPAALFNRTEGHPLFLIDLLHDLKNAGFISLEEGHWILRRRLDEINDLPDSVRAMVDRQIAGLNDAHRALLEAASVEGYRFHSAVLADMLGESIAGIEAWLDELQTRHGLVRCAGDAVLGDSTLATQYSFTHALYVNAAYSRLRASRRAALSVAAAESLIKRHRGSVNEIASQLGQLFEAAREWERASEFYVIAASNAAQRSGYREAEELSQHAMEIAKRLDGPIRDRRLLDAALQLARTRQALSRFDEAIKSYEEVEKLAAAIGDVETQVDAIGGAAFAAGMLKRTDEMRERALHAIEVGKAAGASTAYPESVLGFQQIFVGDLAGSRENHERALAGLRGRRPSPQGAFAAVTYAFLHDLQSEYSRADELLVEAIDQIQVTHAWSDVLRARWFHGMVLANLGRLGEALDTLTKAMELSDLSGERYWYSRFPNTIGWIYSELSDFDTALRLNIEGVRAGQEAGTLEAEANSHINLVNTYVALGDLRSAYEHLRKGENILNEEKQKHWLRWRFRIRFDLAEANYRLACGDPAQARISAENALVRAESALARKHAASAYRMLGDIEVREGRYEEALVDYNRGLAVLRQHPCPLVECKLLRAVADAAALAGKRAQSEHLLGKSRDKAARLAESLADARLRTSFLNAHRMDASACG